MTNPSLRKQLTVSFSIIGLGIGVAVLAVWAQIHPSTFSIMSVTVSGVVWGAVMGWHIKAVGME